MAILIFSDIDGTIKPENGNISENCIKAIKKITEKNIEFVLVTGRNRQKTEKFAEIYGGSRYIISSNGGEVFDTKARKIIYSTPIPKSSIKKLYQYALKYKLRFILNVNDDFRFTSRVKYFDGSEQIIDDIDRILNNYQVFGGLFTEIPNELINMAEQEIIDTEGVVIGNQGKNKDDNFIDFISEYANKGIAIKKLIKYLDVDYKNTISLGNERNDISMFSATGYSVAVGNSCAEIKRIVDEVIESVNDDGVAKFLIRFMKSPISKK